ncbi:MAG: preprotein translocase subunit SecG [Phycisphaerales bacterium]|nr:preprotein translocase subunit SecG [Phycisphaerales bacterium]
MLIGICLFLMLVILLQRGRGGGVAGAFGGGGGSGAFGAKTGDVFTWITVIVAVIFVGLAVAANFAFDESRIASAEKSALEKPADGENASTTQTFPIKIGEDGQALPIDLDSIQITTSAIPGQGDGGGPPTEAKPASVTPPGGDKPAAGEKSPDKPKEDSANP